MKQMKKIVVMLALCASTQALGWVIRFDDNALNKKYDILTFETQGDYDRMMRQANGGKQVNQAALKIVPIVGKVSKTGAVIAPDPELKAALAAVATASGILDKVLKTGVVQKTFGNLTKEGYTIDYVNGFNPTAKNNYKCKDKKSLEHHTIHPIKKNADIYYVIYDKETNKVLYSNSGPAYGLFNFKLVKYEDQAGKKSDLRLGDLKLIDKEAGKSCPSKSGDFHGVKIHRG